MKRPPWIVHTLGTAILFVMTGCTSSDDRRLAEQAERHEQRQAEQNLQNVELHREVAEATRQLVEADAKARQEMATLQSAIQAERQATGRQRDQLEEDRRGIAKSRLFDSLTAAAITDAGLLLACLLPLGLIWLLLRRANEPASDQLVVETLLDDFSAAEPKLLLKAQPAASSGSLRLSQAPTPPTPQPDSEED